MHPGLNWLSIEGENRPAAVTQNPAGLLCRLELCFSDNSRAYVDSGSDWLASMDVLDGWQNQEVPPGAWVKAQQLGAYGCAPWGEVAPVPKITPPFCAGKGDELRLVYLVQPGRLELAALKPGQPYQAQWFDPVAGTVKRRFSIKADTQGKVMILSPSVPWQDWVLVLRTSHSWW